MDSRTVGPYLVFIRLAWTIGYNIFISKELILTEVLEVASLNRLARSIFYVFVFKKKKVVFSAHPQIGNRTMT